MSDRYFDIFVEYAKHDVDDILVRVTVINRGPDPAPLHLLPTVWFRNTWSWGYGTPRPELARLDSYSIGISEQTLGNFQAVDGRRASSLLSPKTKATPSACGTRPTGQPYVKDAFHRYLIQGEKSAVNPDETGTKACGVYQMELNPGGSKVLHFRLHSGDAAQPGFRRGFSRSHQGSRRVLQLRSRPAYPTMHAAFSARPLPACCGASSFTITSSSSG